MTMIGLYRRAAADGIEIIEVHTREIEAAAFEEGFIFLDPNKFANEIEMKCALAHEIGHCETGSFYNIHCPYDLWERCERKANKRAAEILMPLKQVIRAMHHGCTTVWALAQKFEVTEEFAQIALDIYEADLIHDQEKRQMNAVLKAVGIDQPPVHRRHDIPNLKRARDLLPPEPVAMPTTGHVCIENINEWRDDVYMKMGFNDEW